MNAPPGEMMNSSPRASLILLVSLAIACSDETQTPQGPVPGSSGSSFEDGFTPNSTNLFVSSLATNALGDMPGYGFTINVLENTSNLGDTIHLTFCQNTAQNGLYCASNGSTVQITLYHNKKLPFERKQFPLHLRQALNIGTIDIFVSETNSWLSSKEGVVDIEITNGQATGTISALMQGGEQLEHELELNAQFEGPIRLICFAATGRYPDAEGLASNGVAPPDGEEPTNFFEDRDFQTPFCQSYREWP